MDNVYSFAILVPTPIVGLIIGKGGVFCKQILSDTEAQFYFQSKDDIPETSMERALTIFGTKNDIMTVFERIMTRIEVGCANPMLEASAASDGSQVEQTEKWLIRQDVCGSLIGRNGEGIKAIHRLSGAWVKVAHVDELREASSERLLYIRGTSEQNVIALNYVRDNFGGRPFSTVHESKMQFSDGCSIVVPVDALPFIVTSRLDGDIFPINFNLVLGGAELFLELLPCRCLIRLILTGPRAQRAMNVVEQRLFIWKNRDSDPSLMSEAFLSPPASASASTQGKTESLTAKIYGVSFVIASPLVDWLLNSASAPDGHFLTSLMAKTGSYVKLLPQCNLLSRTCDVRKFSVIAPSLTTLLETISKMTTYIYHNRVDAIPNLPLHIIKRHRIEQLTESRQSLVPSPFSAPAPAPRSPRPPYQGAVGGYYRGGPQSMQPLPVSMPYTPSPPMYVQMAGPSRTRSDGGSPPAGYSDWSMMPLPNPPQAAMRGAQNHGHGHGHGQGQGQGQGQGHYSTAAGGIAHMPLTLPHPLPHSHPQSHPQAHTYPSQLSGGRASHGLSSYQIPISGQAAYQLQAQYYLTAPSKPAAPAAAPQPVRTERTASESPKVYYQQHTQSSSTFHLDFEI